MTKILKRCLMIGTCLMMRDSILALVAWSQVQEFDSLMNPQICLESEAKNFVPKPRIRAQPSMPTSPHHSHQLEVCFGFAVLGLFLSILWCGQSSTHPKSDFTITDKTWSTKN